jgi:hypothetical protein
MEDIRNAPLPRMMVLNYVTRPNTLTRTRRIAAGVLMALGLSVLIGSAVLLFLAAYRSYLHATYYGGWVFYTPYAAAPSYGPAPSLSIAVRIRYGLESFVTFPEAWWGAVLLGLAISYLLLAGGVRRGSRRAARFAAWLIAAAVPGLLLLSSSLLAAGIVNLFGLYGMRERWLGLMLVPGIFSVIATLLALDVHAMLRWAARNPAGEMEKRAFLPGNV